MSLVGNRLPALLRQFLDQHTPATADVKCQQRKECSIRRLQPLRPLERQSLAQQAHGLLPRLLVVVEQRFGDRLHAQAIDRAPALACTALNRLQQGMGGHIGIHLAAMPASDAAGEKRSLVYSMRRRPADSMLVCMSACATWVWLTSRTAFIRSIQVFLPTRNWRR